jgi:hypothetical protein
VLVSLSQSRLAGVDGPDAMPAANATSVVSRPGAAIDSTSRRTTPRLRRPVLLGVQLTRSPHVSNVLGSVVFVVLLDTPSLDVVRYRRCPEPDRGSRGTNDAARP